MRNFGAHDTRHVGGMCTDFTGLLGTPGAKVTCADLKAAQEGKPQGYYTPHDDVADDSLLSRAADSLDETFGITDKPAAPTKDRVIAYVGVATILGLGAYTLYQRRSS